MPCYLASPLPSSTFPTLPLSPSPAALLEKLTIMVTVRRGWCCAATCDPTHPCYAPGCPNAHRAYFPDPHYNPNPQPFWRRLWWSAPRRPRPPPPPPGPPSYPGPSGPGTVRIGVGNRSNTDIDIDVRDNLVRGGRRRVDIGSGNYAGRSNMGTISNNVADADDLMIGADNYARGDNNVRVRNNDFRGYGRVRIGSGNYAGGSNRIVVDGFASGSNEGPHPRRWWLF